MRTAIKRANELALRTPFSPNVQCEFGAAFDIGEIEGVCEEALSVQITERKVLHHADRRLTRIDLEASTARSAIESDIVHGSRHKPIVDDEVQVRVFDAHALDEHCRRHEFNIGVHGL